MSTKITDPQGITLHRSEDGIWLSVEVDGKYGAINLRAIGSPIAREVFIAWAKQQLDAVKQAQE